MANLRPYPLPTQGTRELPTAYDQTRVSPEAYGGGAGQALEQIGSAAAGYGAERVAIAQKAKADADAAQVVGGIGAAKKVVNDVILDPQKGFRSLTGEDAIANRDKYLEQVDKALQGIDSGLANDEQRRAFRAHAVTIREEAFRHAVSHEAQAAEQVATAKFQGAQDETIRTLANVATDPLERQRQLQSLAQISVAEARRKFGPNAPKEAVDSVVVPALEKGALTVMGGALGSRDLRAAEQAFQVVGDYLGPHRATVEKSLAAMRSDQTAEIEGSKLLAQAVDPKSGWVNPEKAQQLLASMPESPLKGDVEGYVLKRLKNTEAFRTEQTSQRVGLVFQQGADAQGRLDLSKVSPAVKGWMQQNAPEKWTEIKARAAKDAKRDQEEETPEEYQAYLELLGDKATKSDELANMSSAEFEAKWKARLAPKRLTAAAQAFEAAKKPDSLNVEKIVLEQGAGNGLPNKGAPSTWTSTEKKRMYGFLVDQLRDYRRQNPQAKEADLRKFTDDWLIKVNVNDTGMWRDEVTRAEAAALPKYQGKTAEPVGPNGNEKQLIIDAYKARNGGREPTQAEILQRYRRFHGLPETP